MFINGIQELIWGQPGSLIGDGIVKKVTTGVGKDQIPITFPSWYLFTIKRINNEQMMVFYLEMG